MAVVHLGSESKTQNPLAAPALPTAVIQCQEDRGNLFPVHINLEQHGTM